MISLIIKSMRPKQWTKNLAIFMTLLFSFNLTHPDKIILTVSAFIVFCILSGAIYIFNDIIDIENDKKHPQKRTRPIASGALDVRTAIIVSIVLAIGSIISGYLLNTNFANSLLLYFFIQIAYTLYLKNIVILDVICIATGFLIRVAAGAEVISLAVSSWLLICTIFLALFLALSKRKHELSALNESAVIHRKVLKEYSMELLNQMISIVAACTIITYSLYTMSLSVQERFGNDNLKYTIPFVIYGVFRYLYLVHKKGEGGSPEEVLLRDIPMIINIVLYVGISVFVIYKI